MYKAHTNAWEANLALPQKHVKCQRRTIILAILVDLLSPGVCAKIHLGQWTATILAIFRSPNLRRLHVKFKQHWPRGFRGEVVWNSQHFSHTNVWSPHKPIGKQTWPRHKKVKRQCTTIILATLVDLPSLMICAKIQPKASSVLVRRLLKIFTIYGQCDHFGQWTETILAIFCASNLRRLHMEFEQHWPRGFRGGHLKFSTFFPYKWCPYKWIRKQTWPRRKKVKRQCTTIILATFPRFVQRYSSKASLVLEKKIFKGFYHMWAWRPSWSTDRDLFTSFSFPNLWRLHMKCEQNWLSSFRGEVVWKY